MTADRPMFATATRRLLAVLVAAFAALISPAVMFAAPASAATDIATDCSPDPETACVSPIVLDGNNDPVAGIEVTIAGEGFEAVVVSPDKGSASVEVPDAGTYTMTVTESTIPEGNHADPAEPIEVSAQTGGTARGAFTIGEGQAPAPGETGDESSAPADETVGAADPAVEGNADGLQDDGVSVSGIPSFAQVWQQFGSGMRFGLLLALASVGLSLIFGTTGISSFSHGEQVVIGAMGGWVLINQMGLPIWAGALVIVAIGALTGLIQDAGLWRPLRRRGTPAAQLMLVTIGLSLALQYAVQMINNGSMRILTSNPVPIDILGITLSRASWISMGIALVVIVAIAVLLTKTRIGRAIRAVADNRSLASATGIDPDAVVRIVWVCSTGLAALSGLLIAISFGSFTWNLGVQLLLLMFAAVTLGGLGTAYGALLGSILIGLVVEMSNLILPSDLRYATALLILILVLLIRPQGILGSRERIG